MEISELLTHVDHTKLDVASTWEEIKALCDEGIQYHTASVCLPPLFVRRAVNYVKGKVPVCTVIGFPNGYNTTTAKCYEAKEAIENGAAEIDMVISIGMLKEGKDAAVLDELTALRRATEGSVLKVIIETCLLNDEEKKRMCRLVLESGADYIKTSTGFSTGGATREDIALMRAAIPTDSPLKIKAAGGIKTIKDAENFLLLGADRLGTSRLVALAKEMGV